MKKKDRVPKTHFETYNHYDTLKNNCILVGDPRTPKVRKNPFYQLDPIKEKELMENYEAKKLKRKKEYDHAMASPQENQGEVDSDVFPKGNYKYMTQEEIIVQLDYER